MKKLSISFFSLLLLVSVMFGAAYAAENKQVISGQAGNEETIQAIRENLSVEYGVKISVASDEQLKLVGLDKTIAQQKAAAINAKEYEAYLRNLIEQEKKNSNEAVAKAEAAGIKKENSKPIITPNQSIITPQSIITVEKNIDNAKARLKADLVTTGPTHLWGTVEQAWTVTGPAYGVPNPPYFGADTWSYNKIDGNRTVAVSFHGFLIDGYGTVINNDVSRYVEFYAGSY